MYSYIQLIWTQCEQFWSLHYLEISGDSLQAGQKNNSLAFAINSFYWACSLSSFSLLICHTASSCLIYLCVKQLIKLSSRIFFCYPIVFSKPWRKRILAASYSLNYDWISCISLDSFLTSICNLSINDSILTYCPTIIFPQVLFIAYVTLNWL